MAEAIILSSLKQRVQVSEAEAMASPTRAPPTAHTSLNRITAAPMDMAISIARTDTPTVLTAT